MEKLVIQLSRCMQETGTFLWARGQFDSTKAYYVKFMLSPTVTEELVKLFGKF